MTILSIFIKTSLKDEACQAVFGASWAASPTRRFPPRRRLLTKSVHCNPETELCVHRVVGPFPSYFVANESSKEPWRTEEHCLFVFERENSRGRGGRREEARGGKTLGEPPDRAPRPGGGGVLGSVAEIEVLTRLRPPDRFPDTYK